MSKPLLQVITASTRPGRIGGPIAEWIAGTARHHGGFEVEEIDLRDVNLPAMDEATHPRLGTYEHAHTKEWAATIDRADAFLFVIPEYNFHAPPALVNALDFLFNEWGYKPAGLVSYGGVSAGLRSAESLKGMLAALKIVAIPEAVSIPFAGTLVSDGSVEPNQQMRDGADAMLNELVRWEEALRGLRRGN